MNFTINTIKFLLIEIISLGASFLADMLLTEAGQENIAIRYAFDLRIYYLYKNILYQLHACLTDQNDYSHLYAGTFNLGVATSILSVSSLLQTSNNIPNKITAESIIYGSASMTRMLVEIFLSGQTAKQHLFMHKAKLLGGAAGIFISLASPFGIASPAFYWSGELFDVWQNKKTPQSIQKILLKPQATVPIQVFLAELIKSSVKFAGKTIPFPGFIIDFMIGTVHRLIADRVQLTSSRAQTIFMKSRITKIKRLPLHEEEKVVNDEDKENLTELPVKNTLSTNHFSLFYRANTSPVPQATVAQALQIRLTSL